MDQEEFFAIDPKSILKTYCAANRKAVKPIEKQINTIHSKTPSKAGKSNPSEPLTTKNAVQFLLEGSLRSMVCRYCLKVCSELSELEKVMQVANTGVMYKVTIMDMIGSFHPFKVLDDPSLPNKICNKCLDRTISSYLFTQQCEQSERALVNCLGDMYDKLQKLDPLERTKKRGRQKLNHNILHTEHKNVINYADPIIHLVHNASEPLTKQSPIQKFECLKCCQVLPNVESLLNHAKTHPKSMWFNCRLCGKSFAKINQLKKHVRQIHACHKPEVKQTDAGIKFDCQKCGISCPDYYEYLQHVEKHKFKMVIEHLLDRKMDKLCAICLNKGNDMVPLENMIGLHGGCPQLMGDRSMYSILASVLPEMNVLQNYTGTKICEKCLNNAITSYVFINQTYFVRNRLNTCVSHMLENLENVKSTTSNVCIEIAKNFIMAVKEPFDENLLLTEEDYIDEFKLEVDVLEDEFRIKSEGESETEDVPKPGNGSRTKLEPSDAADENEQKQYSKNKCINGFQFENSICSEFLTLRKKKLSHHKRKFTCPVCRKHFVSDYFLKRHVLKHVNNKVECAICNLQFNSKFRLYEHNKMSHLLNQTVFAPCHICGRCFTDELKLQRHEDQHWVQFCELCGKSYKSQRYYEIHMKRHMRKLRVPMRKYSQNCSFCEKDCANDNEFSLHVNKVHLQIKPYGCDMCERQFYTEYNLKSHKKVHSVRSREKCTFCSKILESRSKLVTHIRKHIGETPFFCQICNDSFYSQSKLDKHMKIYHGGRFCCKYCKIAFNSKCGLKQHANKVHAYFS